MSDIVKVIEALPQLLKLAPAGDMEIESAEKQLNLTFAPEYKEYLKKFGAIIADGIELTGIAKSERTNVVNATKSEWALNSDVPHTMYVVESLGIDGIVIWQDAKGEIFQTAPNEKPKKVSSSLAEYLKKK